MGPDARWRTLKAIREAGGSAPRFTKMTKPMQLEERVEGGVNEGVARCVVGCIKGGLQGGVEEV